VPKQSIGILETLALRYIQWYARLHPLSYSRPDECAFLCTLNLIRDAPHHRHDHPYVM